jgi:hypothetical protein
LVPQAQAAATEQRIDWAERLIAEIDRLMVTTSKDEFKREMARLRPEIERANMSTVCDKRELNIDVKGPKLNYGQVAHMILEDAAQVVSRAFTAPFRRPGPVPASMENE